MTRLVFFDLDGTLIDAPSSERSLLQHLIFSYPLGVAQYINTIAFLLRWAPKFKQYVFLKDKAYLAGLPKEKIENFAKEFVIKKIIPRLRPNLCSRVTEHRQNKDINVLLTGAHEFIANPIAEHLKMDEIIATKCASHNGLFINKPPLQHPFRKEKLILAERMCARYGTTLAHSVGYGNSINDNILLSEVGHPVAVTPDCMLRKIAKKKKWEIIDKKQ